VTGHAPVGRRVPAAGCGRRTGPAVGPRRPRRLGRCAPI